MNIAIAGHADKGTGTKRINQKLSEQRAAAVKAFLTERGIAESRIVSVVANGDRIQPFEETVSSSAPSSNQLTLNSIPTL